jgi:hypothetical protein
MANTIIAVRYTSDRAGQEFITGMNSEITTQLGTSTDPKVGVLGDVSDTGLPALPSSVKPRRVGLKNAAGKWRYVVCLTPDSELYTGVETTLSIEDSDGAASTYTRQRAIGENFGRNRGS